MKYPKFHLFCLCTCFISLLPKLVAMEPLQVADDQRHFETTTGKPFFWLGDTGWLMLRKLDRQDTCRYLSDREKKEINVIQVMVLHSLADTTNAYGIPAIAGSDIASPNVIPGSEMGPGGGYDFWDHLEWALKQAEARGIYLALVPVWGSNIEPYHVTAEQALTYGRFLGERFKDAPNVIWLNGGDIDGSEHADVWDALAKGIREKDTGHLMTFHPRGRLMSSMWFHDRDWLDFNMFQSGHRRYDQDDSELSYGEDNWRYVAADLEKTPAKPTLDGEPSYEAIPEGLHDISEPLWTDDDVRRYAYGSVFAGGCGFTYGHNSIMQFYTLTEKRGAYGAYVDWKDALDAPGAWQMRYLRRLMESRPATNRRPAQEILLHNDGEKRAHMLATCGEAYAMVYTYTGKPIEVKLGFLPGEKIQASWFDPRNGGTFLLDTFENQNGESLSFDPPGAEEDGNDWVLILESR